MTIYVVIEEVGSKADGSYYRRVVGVYSTKEAAIAVCAKDQDNRTYGEYTLDETPEDDA